MSGQETNVTQLGLILDVADTYHDMVKPPNRFTLKQDAGRCVLNNVTSPSHNSNPISNLEQVRQVLSLSDAYKNIVQIQGGTTNVLLKSALLLGQNDKNTYVKTYLPSRKVTDFENDVMLAYEEDKTIEKKGIEQRDVKLSRFTGNPMSLFPEPDKPHSFLMDAFKDQTFYDMYMAKNNAGKTHYIECIASEWDQAYKIGGAEVQKKLGFTIDPIGNTGNYINFEPKGPSMSVTLYHKNKYGVKTPIGYIDYNSIKILDLGVRSLCNTLRLAHLERETPLSEIIRNNLIKAMKTVKAVTKNKNNKRARSPSPSLRVQDFVDANEEPILAALYNFLVQEGEFQPQNLFHIKRSGDYGQIGAVKAMTTNKHDERFYLTTFDKLCYLRSKFEKVPCVRVKDGGVLDIYHGEISAKTTLINMLNVGILPLPEWKLQSPELVMNPLNNPATLDTTSNSVHEVLRSWDVYSQSGDLANVIKDTHRNIYEGLRSLVTTRNNLLLRLVEIINSVQGFPQDLTETSSLENSKQSLLQQLQSMKDGDKVSKKLQEGVQQTVGDINRYNAQVELFNALYILKIGGPLVINQPTKTEIILKNKLFGHNSIPFEDGPVLNNNEAIQTLGFGHLFEQPIVSNFLNKRITQAYDKCLLIHRVRDVKREDTVADVLKRIYSFAYASTRGATMVGSLYGIFERMLQLELDALHSYEDVLADIAVKLGLQEHQESNVGGGVLGKHGREEVDPNNFVGQPAPKMLHFETHKDNNYSDHLDVLYGNTTLEDAFYDAANDLARYFNANLQEPNPAYEVVYNNPEAYDSMWTLLARYRYVFQDKVNNENMKGIIKDCVAQSSTGSSSHGDVHYFENIEPAEFYRDMMFNAMDYTGAIILQKYDTIQMNDDERKDDVDNTIRQLEFVQLDKKEPSELDPSNLGLVYVAIEQQWLQQNTPTMMTVNGGAQRTKSKSPLFLKGSHMNPFKQTTDGICYYQSTPQVRDMLKRYVVQRILARSNLKHRLPTLF